MIDIVIRIIGIIFVAMVVELWTTPITAKLVSKNKPNALIIVTAQMTIKVLITVSLTILLF